MRPDGGRAGGLQRMIPGGAPGGGKSVLWFADCRVTYLKSLRNNRELLGVVFLPDAVCPPLPQHLQVPREPVAFVCPSGIAVLGSGSSWAQPCLSLGLGMYWTQLGLTHPWGWTQLQACGPSSAH